MEEERAQFYPQAADEEDGAGVGTRGSDDGARCRAPRDNGDDDDAWMNDDDDSWMEEDDEVVEIDDDEDPDDEDSDDEDPDDEGPDDDFLVEDE